MPCLNFCLTSLISSVLQTPSSSLAASLQENKGQVQALFAGSFLKVCQSSSEANPGVLRDFIPTLFCQCTKHLIYLSTILLSFNSVFPSYSCLHLSTLNSLLYSSHDLQFSFLPLDSLGLSTARACFCRCYDQSPHPKVFQPHFTMEIHQPTVFTSRTCSTPLYSLQRDLHLFWPPALPLAGVSTPAGTSLLPPATFLKAQAQSCPSFPAPKRCCADQNMTTSLLTFSFPTLCHPKPWNHFISLQYSVHWEHEVSVRKRLLQKNCQNDDSKATSYVYIVQSPESFQDCCFPQSGGRLYLLSLICKILLVAFLFNPSCDTVLLKLMTTVPLFLSSDL